MKHFTPDSVIYHGGCYDGFTSAWLLWKAFGDIEFLPATYGKAFPNPSGKNVLMVDFGHDQKFFTRDDAKALNNRCEKFLILDHHVSAEKALEGLDFVEFDMERAGCQMARDWIASQSSVGFEPRELGSWLIDHVADRDLWKLELPNTPAVHAYYSSVPMTFMAWSDLAAMDKDEVVRLGGAIRQSIDRYCEKVGAEASDIWTPWGATSLVNVPYLNASELASWLLDNRPHPWSVAWFQRADGRFQYSLRGRDFDVSEVAKALGGGGHVGAAGFDSDNPPWDLWPLQNAFRRGRDDAYQDACENCHFASVGGEGGKEPEIFSAPDWIAAGDDLPYIAGYKLQGCRKR